MRIMIIVLGFALVGNGCSKPEETYLKGTVPLESIEHTKHDKQLSPRTTIRLPMLKQASVNNGAIKKTPLKPQTPAGKQNGVAIFIEWHGDHQQTVDKLVRRAGARELLVDNKGEVTTKDGTFFEPTLFADKGWPIPGGVLVFPVEFTEELMGRITPYIKHKALHCTIKIEPKTGYVILIVKGTGKRIRLT
ncbi:MAG: hypothetical protein HQL69_12245 [Magnetococcales bacterium]|nr:hypothetical protein [Magnetococcales bacterium]